MSRPQGLDVERLLADEHARATPQKRVPALDALERSFQAIDEDRYRLEAPALGIVLEVDRLRREHGELNGELSVQCDLPGARTYDRILSLSDFNLSSARARTDRAKFLATRSNAGEFDWVGLIEEFCQRVLRAERTGKPAIDLRTLAPVMADELIAIDGLSLPKRHPSILFGDGGCAKSYLSLYLGGKLAQMGMPVAYFDWELAGDEHRDRLQKLFPDFMPKIRYARCDRPLIHEADRLRRIVTDKSIEFAVFDSIAFASDAAPEAAETAAKYFRSVRQIGVGSLHVAHITKGQDSDKKPFGSAFWHNGARSTWYVSAADGSREEGVLQIGLFNRKSNLGRLCPATGFAITFADDRTIFRRSNPAGSADLAVHLSIRQRMAFLLRNGSLDAKAVAEELDADAETIKRTARRYKNLFTVLEGNRIGLLEKRTTQWRTLCPRTPGRTIRRQGGGHSPFRGSVRLSASRVKHSSKGEIMNPKKLIVVFLSLSVLILRRMERLVAGARCFLIRKRDTITCLRADEPLGGSSVKVKYEWQQRTPGTGQLTAMPAGAL